MVPFRRALSQNYVSLAEGRIERAKTDGDLAAELWLALRQLAEVEEVGIGLLHSHNAERRSRAADVLAGEWREFRAYIRQAENFYQGASVLHWTSSPLNYYYAFLNLAKASCLLADTFKPRTILGGGVVAATPRHVNHGLSEKTLIGSRTRWTVTVRAPTDVFSLYYQLSLDHCVIPATVLEIHDLLGYSLPIGWQLRRSGYSDKIRAFQCRWTLLRDGKETWDLVVMPQTVPTGLLPRQFEDQYDEVDPASIKDAAVELFSMRAVEALQMRFFQRRTPYALEANGDFHGRIMIGDFKRALPNAAFPNLSDATHEFTLCGWCPTEDGATVPMNSEIATYATWFYLSSLVRYHPDYMESIATSNDAWLIESFVKSAPLDLLRQLTARILGYSLVMLRM